MGQVIVLQREMWLKPACLMVSVVLHVGLGLALWQSLKSLPIADRPIVVTLVARPASVPVKPATSVSVLRSSNPAVAPRRATTSVVKTPPKGQQAAVPVVVDSDDRLPEEEGPANGSPVIHGEGEGADRGFERDGDRAGRERADRLIKATPRVEYNASPVYPDVARESRWEGTVRVRARVTAAGDVESVSLVRSSGHAMLDRSALDAVRQWRFIPATRNGVPVVSEQTVQVPFHLPK